MKMTDKKPPFTKLDLLAPDLENLREVLEDGIKDNFSDITVSVMDCPDLTQPPYDLAAKGLSGHACVTDTGGPPYLLPLVQRQKKYSIEDICEVAGVPHGFAIGAGAGPCHVVGVNSELMTNIYIGKDSSERIQKSSISKVHPKDGSCVLEQVESSDCCLLSNNYICDGHTGKVLEVKAKHRKGEMNFMECLRKSLANKYGDQPVAIGGTFLVKSGTVKGHIMPDFSEVPLECQEDVDKWLKFYDMSAPLTCVGYLVSHDPGLDLRMEHFHFFSDHGDGGHYHYDITPEEVEYHGYFNVAEALYRIDQPPSTFT